ncbi:amidohydrolase [Gordonia polyisoprenivorans]|uniref:amidohydrolase n=1 Tax=Gordonia polyisoprenivorans TaxID=84595 RepID=UPI002300F6F7|nr:amidohydrolase [Gordonia polyisoprenivorans]WCB35405.1 amidohydrolase [Gordonia polyisoprenivorans]
MTITDAHADLVFCRGPVLTADAARSRCGGVAVADGRIVALGSEVTDRIGPRTEVVNLEGRLLVPAFQDAHVHPVGAMLESLRCDLTEVADESSTVAAVAAYAAAHPATEWICGGGWSLEAFAGGTPTAAMLDRVVTDRPVYLPNRVHHGAWVNSRALERAGIDRDTPDPAGGRIERDRDGHPTGMLQESAMNLVGRLVPAPSLDDMTEALLAAQAHLHSLGVGAWQDALVGAGGPLPDTFDAYVKAADDGLLTARVVLAQWWDRDRGAEQIADLLERRALLERRELDHHRSAGGRLRADTVKLMVDGIAESHTAAMLDPYLTSCGCPGTHRGTTFIEPDALARFVVELDAAGFQTHFHALGDRAVRDALDAIEAARVAHGFRDTRPHLAHLQVVAASDIRRFRDLGATANIQPLWAAHEPQMDELTIPFLGPERTRRQYPFADLVRAGATIAAGSDWPVSSADPWHGIHVAVNRVLPGAGSDAAVFLPEQRIDLMTAIAAYTAGSAHVNRRDSAGTIRVGADADLVVLDRDPFEHPADQIAETRVAQTYLDGRCVHRATWDRG